MLAASVMTVILLSAMRPDEALAAGSPCAGVAAIVDCPTGAIDGDGVTLSVEGGGSGSGSPHPGQWDPGQVICPSLELQYPCFYNWHHDDGDEDVTIRDVRHFPVRVGTALMEPGGWTVVKLPTNFYAHAPVHEVPGQLLGKPARVRFIPIRYFWDYGDGTAAVKTLPGATWRALGLAEFSKTPTSHVYQQPATVRIRLSIEYAAAYRWAGSEWMQVIGTITLPANELVTVVARAETVLVDQTCTTNPGGPGC